MTRYEFIKTLSLNNMALLFPCPYGRRPYLDTECNDKNCTECTKEWLSEELPEDPKKGGS